LRRIVERRVELEDLVDAAVPLSLVAFDINAGTEAVLCDGPAVDAIVAACSIPGILPPVAIGELAAQLDPDRFVRIHRAYVVNIERIEKGLKIA